MYVKQQLRWSIMNQNYIFLGANWAKTLNISNRIEIHKTLSLCVWTRLEVTRCSRCCTTQTSPTIHQCPFMRIDLQVGLIQWTTKSFMTAWFHLALHVPIQVTSTSDAQKDLHKDTHLLWLKTSLCVTLELVNKENRYIRLN